MLFGDCKMRNLYKFSLYEKFQEAVRQAVQEVEMLDRRAFANPALAGDLQRIAEKYNLEVGHIHKENVKASRRHIEHESEDVWGDRRKFRQTWLDVEIPFSGNKEAFLLSPSFVSHPSCDAEIGSSSLVISIPDDDRADNAVQSFIGTISNNLELLRTEYGQMKPQLIHAASRAAERRKQQIDAEAARDQTRSFKIVD
jgi:hypothetical protein